MKLVREAFYRGVLNIVNKDNYATLGVMQLRLPVVVFSRKKHQSPL